VSEFLQGLIVGAALTAGIMALGWWVTQTQRPRTRPPAQDHKPLARPARPARPAPPSARRRPGA
jgi:hypothetical protein